MVVRTLLPLVRILNHFPRSWDTAFARVLNAATAPFNVVNYWGSRAATLVYNRKRMGHKLESTTRALAKRLDRETRTSLTRTMDFPNRWDPFFTPGMTRAEVYAYPTLDFAFHARQLTLNQSGTPTP